MGSWSTAFLLVTAVLIGFGVHKFNEVPDLPEIPLGYWSVGNPKPDDLTIHKFQINVPESVVKDLHARLDRTRELAKPLEGVNFNYGFSSPTLKKILHFWRNEYNWTERQTYMNQFPQFKTQIAGLKIHFLHVKPKKRGIPLLLLHGWPGSVREFYDLIPLLTTSTDDFAFEVVAPSLVGYGWSEAASKPGLGPAQMGNIFVELMKRLGHDKFYIQGGDWGSIIGSSIASLKPQNVIGYHTNMCFSLSRKSTLLLMLGLYFPSIHVEEHKQEEFPSTLSFMMKESGYLHLQATKPDTIGVALSDSPAGLAAYILEKFSTWTNKGNRDLVDGGLLSSPYGMTALLDNVMIYWITNSITTSMRLYSEALSASYFALKLDEAPVLVPAACARFAEEITYCSGAMLRTKFHNLVQTTDYLEGGHFPAMEKPKVLADDIRRFVETVEKSSKKKFKNSS